MLALQAPLGGTAGEPAPARRAASGGAANGTAGKARGDEEEQTVAGYWRAHGHLTHVRRITTLLQALWDCKTQDIRPCMLFMML